MATFSTYIFGPQTHPNNTQCIKNTLASFLNNNRSIVNANFYKLLQDTDYIERIAKYVYKYYTWAWSQMNPFSPTMLSDTLKETLVNKIYNLYKQQLQQDQEYDNLKASITNLIDAIKDDLALGDVVAFLMNNQNNVDVLDNFCKQLRDSIEGEELCLPLDNSRIVTVGNWSALIDPKRQIIKAIIQSIANSQINSNNVMNNNHNLNLNFQNNQVNQFIKSNNMIVNVNQQANNQMMMYNIKQNAQNINPNNQFNQNINVIPCLQPNNQFLNINNQQIFKQHPLHTNRNPFGNNFGNNQFGNNINQCGNNLNLNLRNNIPNQNVQNNPSNNNPLNNNINPFVNNFGNNNVNMLVIHNRNDINNIQQDNRIINEEHNLEDLDEQDYNKFIQDVLNNEDTERYRNKMIENPQRFQNMTNVCWLRRLFNCCTPTNQIRLDDVVREKIKMGAPQLSCQSIIDNYRKL